MPSNYPGAIDDFSESSPTYMSDPDTTGRVHSRRHDDVESAVEQIEETLGVNPQGPNATVADRLLGISSPGPGAWTEFVRPVLMDANAAGETVLEIRGDNGNRSWFDYLGQGQNYQNATLHNFALETGQNIVVFDQYGIAANSRRVPTAMWDETVGRRLFIWDTTNARWQMVYSDTGMRNISAILQNSWTGSVRIRRYGPTVFISFASLSGTNATSDTIYTLPAGFRPYATQALAGANGSSFFPVTVSTSGAVTAPRAGATQLWTAVAWATSDLWPTALPGDVDSAIPTAETLLPPDWTPDIDPDIPTGLSPDTDTSDWTVTYPEGPTP